MAALSCMANRDHPAISIEPGDVVVLASSLIPGNENAVARVINGLTRWAPPSFTAATPRCIRPATRAAELLYAYNLQSPTPCRCTGRSDTCMPTPPWR